MNEVTVTFETEDGRTLKCKYTYHTTPGFTSGLPEDCHPDETDVGDPSYFLDGVPVEESDLSKELREIARQMYEADEFDKRFTYKDEYVEEDGPEDC